MSDNEYLAFMVLGCVLFFGIVIGLAVWTQFNAPCTWFSLADAPLRCIK